MTKIVPMGTVLRCRIVLGALALAGCPAKKSATAPTPPDDQPAAVAGLCEQVRALIDAGGDGKFVSIRGASTDDEATADSPPESFASTITPPGAITCEILTEDEEIPAVVSCTMFSGDRADSAKRHAQLVTEVAACLPAGVWTRESHESNVYWNHEPDDGSMVWVKLQARGGSAASYDVSLDFDAVADETHRPRPNELCEPLAQVIEAGNDGHFTELLELPDASCNVDDGLTSHVSCVMLMSDDPSEIEESFQEVSELVSECLTEDAWSVDRAEEDRTYWVHHGDDRTSIVEVQVGVGDWESTVSIVVEAAYQ